MKFLIRNATAADLPILMQFEQGIVNAERPFDDTLKDGQIHYYDLAEKIESPTCCVKVIEVNTVVVASGFAEIRAAKDYYKHNQYGHLGFMYVLPEYRGKGLNQLLLDALIQWCKEREVNEIRLEVYPDNLGAIKAYKKVGFEPQLLQMRLHQEK
ncbi:GNAT family N-acetyltransferase [Aliiglaciecola sp. M165]|uniref:GNAT family N-acetyltransferase n=1 Tax=Aliiglaciecola sp. M165 TaxID=2593649 RepID=UPI00117E9E2E|nr:GNAT family N-acetyltransferase [Aliiglaciecola sp. M165]TRY32478.1 GNAT family N-acetyltransferase [Aliiglaciecola sp. M165]